MFDLSIEEFEAMFIGVENWGRNNGVHRYQGRRYIDLNYFLGGGGKKLRRAWLHF